MNLLILGGAGYIGGVTTHLAKEAGHHVVVADDLSSGRDYNVPEGVELVVGDVRDRKFVASLFADKSYDAVLHFAARILVPESMTNPYDYLAVNSWGALNAIDEAVKAKVKHYIFSSSAAVYGEPKRVPISEDDPTNPLSPYGTSKLLTEKILKSYEITHQLQWAAFRYFNVAGAYQGVGTDYPFISHIVPKLLVAMRDHEAFKQFGDDYDTPDGTAVRDYVHVVDIARAHITALDKMAGSQAINQPINLGSHHGYSVKKVFDTFNEVTGANLELIKEPRRAGDPAKLYASNTRAKELLGWEPQHDLRTMIHDHYEWYKAQTNPNAPAVVQ